MDKIIFCLALGAVLTAAIMRIAHWQICRQGNCPSEYYYKLPRKPTEASTTVLDSFFEHLMLTAIISLFYVVILNVTENYIHVSPDPFECVSKAIQDNLNVLFPPTVAIVAIFATYKKPYHILFHAHDVVKRYRIYSLTKTAVIAWCASIALQAAARFRVLAFNAAFLTVVYSAVFLAEAICFLLLLIVLMTCFRIYLSNQKPEMKILDTLYYTVSVAKPYLRHIDPNDAENLDDVNEYLIGELREKTKKAKRALPDYMESSKVEFWDAVSSPPFPNKPQVLFQLFLLAVLIVPLGFSVGETLCMLRGIEKLPRFVSILSLIVLGIVSFRFIKSPALCQMRRGLVYGRWGYRFLDQKDCPRQYIPCCPMWQTNMTRWFHALLNIITLCRIECANNCHQKLLKSLCDTLDETDEQNSAEQFAFSLALCLCSRLAAEAEPPTAKEAEDKIRQLVSAKFPWGELIDSWAEAIWIDIHRDMEWYRKNRG